MSATQTDTRQLVEGAARQDRAAIEQTPRVRALLEDLLQAVEAGTVTPVLIRACRDVL